MLRDHMSTEGGRGPKPLFRELSVKAAREARRTNPRNLISSGGYFKLQGAAQLLQYPALLSAGDYSKWQSVGFHEVSLRNAQQLQLRLACMGLR